MTEEGILSRGKENYDSKRFLDNSETLAYIATLPKETPVEEEKPKKKAKKEAEDGTNK